MLRAHARRFHAGLHIVDAVLAGGVFVALLASPSGLRPGAPPEATVSLVVVGLLAALAWPMLLEPFGLYRSQRRTGIPDMVARLAGAGAVITLLLVAGTWVARLPVSVSFPLLCGLAQTALIALERIAILTVLRVARRTGHNTRNVLILGSGPRARGIADVIHANAHWGLRVLGFVDNTDAPLDPRLDGQKVHKLIDVPDLLRNEVVDEVIIATPRSMLADVVPAVAACAQVGVPVTLPSDLFGDYLPPGVPSSLDVQSALTFAPVHHNPAALAVKRGIDVAGALVMLVALAPVMALTAIGVKLTSQGPVFFRQVRCGLHGRRFQMIKFRTMVVDAEARKAELLTHNEMDGPVFKMTADPRITRFGRFLRRTSLDELPQLWNVLRGDMSLVGPRPPVPDEVAKYATFERRRLSMRPGLTCLWQVMGRNAIGFAEWVKLDLQYIDNWSLVADVRILLRTLPAVFRGTGS